MKLNKGDKEVIIKRIMADVPAIDHNEECRIMVQYHYKSLLPVSVNKMLADKKLESHVTETQISTPSPLSNVWVRGYFGSSRYSSVDADHAIQGKLRDLANKASAQKVSRKEIENKLVSSFRGINTRKQALDIFPEFEKYLPTETRDLRNLPITTDVVPSLVSAGWPSSQKKSKSKQAPQGQD